MKIKTIHQIRQAELIAFLAGLAGQAYPAIEHMPEILNNGMNALMGNYQEISTIALNNPEFWSLIMTPFAIGTVVQFYAERKTEEYKDLKKYYEEIINRFTDLANSLELTDPIEIFSLYVYMYRGGYFSYQHQFIYDIDMKDLSLLNGLDVIRGRGVCRSISSMLTDIYQKMGFHSNNLSVNTDRETINSLSHLCPLKLEKSQSGSKFAKIIGDFTKVIKLPNHLITIVDDTKYSYTLDPTNDGILYPTKFGKLRVHNNPKLGMQNYISMLTLQSLIGHFSTPNKIPGVIKQLDMDTIELSTFEYLYRNTLGIIERKKSALDEFYENNKDLYEQIYLESTNIHSMIGRMIPVVK